MASSKKSTNPLLAPAVSGFSLSQSFGAQAAVLVPTASAATPVATLQPTAPFTSSPADPSGIAFKSPSLSPMGPPALKPPPAGVFLLPQRGSTPANLGQPLGPPHSVSPALAGHSLRPPLSVSPAGETSTFLSPANLVTILLILFFIIFYLAY